MQKFLLFGFLFFCLSATAQTKVNLAQFNKKGASKAKISNNLLTLNWPGAANNEGQLVLDLHQGKPLFKQINLIENKKSYTIATALDPLFVLTIGKRTLDPKSAGWDVFFDKVPERPFKSYNVVLNKKNVSLKSAGIQTIIRIDGVEASTFKGALEITVYEGSLLFNVAAVMSTKADSTAIIYDAGLLSTTKTWDNISWADTNDQFQTKPVNQTDTVNKLKVKYRTIIGNTKSGSLAVFPAPHQYFYPLDEAFNLKFTWYGNNYQNLAKGFGLGIRQDFYGDKRFVPWFNAPPKTLQRLNFFCFIGNKGANEVLQQVKKFTNDDQYVKLPGYKTMQSHFHNEFIMQTVLAGKPIPEKPEFVDVFKKLGVDVVHLGEFHYTAHPQGPDSLRLEELKALFEQCNRLSDEDFLLLPGEEPNEFFGGHWMQFFPKPVYWIMSRKPSQKFMTDSVGFGKIYRIGNKEEMLKLLELENGFAWTAHARTKGSTFYPDKYKNEKFFKSDRFFGAAWKNIPADLSVPTLSRRVLDLMDDTNNWGLKKHYIGESDLFTITHENEMYAHSNINYLEMNTLPNFNDGWQPVLNAMGEDKFFTSTGEVLLPGFSVNGKTSGETAKLKADGLATINIAPSWTFPLNFIDVISGDGKSVYHHKINMNNKKAFGSEQLSFDLNLKNRKWVRIEAWDVAVNGAFTQTIWLNN